MVTPMMVVVVPHQTVLLLAKRGVGLRARANHVLGQALHNRQQAHLDE